MVAQLYYNYRKKFASVIRMVDTIDPRISCVTIDSNLGPVMIATVYMPV